MSERKSKAKSRPKPEPVVPRFKSEDEERAFWAVHDSVGYVDWAKARPVTLPRLKPSTSRS